MQTVLVPSIECSVDSIVQQCQQVMEGTIGEVLIVLPQYNDNIVPITKYVVLLKTLGSQRIRHVTLQPAVYKESSLGRNELLLATMFSDETTECIILGREVAEDDLESYITSYLKPYGNLHDVSVVLSPTSEMMKCA